MCFLDVNAMRTFVLFLMHWEGFHLVQMYLLLLNCWTTYSIIYSPSPKVHEKKNNELGGFSLVLSNFIYLQGSVGCFLALGKATSSALPCLGMAETAPKEDLRHFFKWDDRVGYSEPCLALGNTFSSSNISPPARASFMAMRPVQSQSALHLEGLYA